MDSAALPFARDHTISRVSFVIPVRTDAERLERCLNSIERTQQRARPQVVVVDNGSLDDSAERAERAGALVLRLPGLPVGELRNRGAQAASGDVLAFVDADHEIDPAWIEAALEDLQDPAVAVVGNLCEAPREGTWVQHMYDRLRGRIVGRHDVDWLGSGNMAIRRQAFEAVNGFDATLESCEDVDLCYRLKQRGFRIVGDDRLRSVHLGDPATLRALFRAELWRGRNNLRATLRTGPGIRDLPSLLMPVATMAFLAASVAGVVGLAIGRPGLLWLSLAGIVAIALLRLAKMMLRTPGLEMSALPAAFAVALTYELARAAALVVRAPHYRAAVRSSTT